MNKNKGFTKSIAFTLVMAMLFATLSFGGMVGLPGMPGVGGAEAYGATTPTPVEAQAATVRIEGYDSTFLPPTEVMVPAGSSALDAVNQAILGKGIELTDKYGMIDTISKSGIVLGSKDPRFEAADKSNYSGWTYYVNDTMANSSIGDAIIGDGDQISIVYSAYGDYAYFENSIITAAVGETFNVKAIKDTWGYKAPLEDARIFGYTDPSMEIGISNGAGVKEISYAAIGTYEITAEKLLQGYTSSGNPINTITRPYAKITIVSSEELNNIIESDWNNLDISYNGTASSIKLPLSGPSGASISWKSSEPGIVSNDGIVKRPVCGSSEVNVTLTAIVGRGSNSKVKEFSITVLPYTEAEVEASLYSMQSREIPKTEVNSPLIYLATYSVDNQIRFAWESSNTDVIGQTQGYYGEVQVTRPAITAGDVAVTLTAIATSGDVKRERYFNVTVKAIDIPAKIVELKVISDGIADNVKNNNLITGSMAYGSEWIMAMISSNNAENISLQDKTNYLAMTLEEARSGSTGIGKKAKLAVALTALGIDPTTLPGIESGEYINFIKELYNDGNNGIFGNQYDIPYVLMAYNLGFQFSGYDYNLLLNKIINKMDEMERGGDFYKYSPSDTVGLYIAVLSPHYNTNATAQGIISRGITWLQNNQKNGTYENANSDAMVTLGMAGLLGNGVTSESAVNFLYQIGDGLLSYKTDGNDGFVGYTGSYNHMATVQGFWGVIAYQNYLNGSVINPYIFNYPTTGLTADVDWPTEKLPLDITVTPPTTVKFTKDERIDASSLNFEVKASYLDGSTVIIPNSLCTVSYLDTSTSGVKEVSVTYLGKTKTFTVIVEDPVTPVVPKEVTLTINGTSVSGKKIVIHNNSTVLSVLQEACGLYGIDILSYKGYVSSMNGLSEFDQGPNSGWLYQVDGNTPSTTGADQYRLSGGERVTWYYTKDFTKDASSSAWVTENQAGAVQDGLVSVTTDVKAVTGSDGTAKATVSTTQLDTAVTDALKAAAASKDDAKPAITIAIEADSKAQGVETVIPKASFANLVNKGIQQMTIESPLGNMTLDLETLKDIVNGGAGDVSLSIKKADESQGRPVIRLEINNGGKTVGTFSKPITITVPYTPAAGENQQGIAVFHLDDKGQWKNIKASKYDSKNKAIVFCTDHFSDFVIACSYKTFGDIKGHWAQTPIEYLASRRIIQGMTEESFAPNGTITRAQFVTLLAGMAGADLSQYSLSQFSDVKDNAWFKGAVVWAAENGIVQGQQAADGSFWFNPNQNISRQDMAVVMMRYLAWAKEPVAETTKAIAFKDGSTIASYAKESVTAMQKAGLINGRTTPDNQTVFDPTGKLTRAEAAQILTNQLYQQF